MNNVDMHISTKETFTIATRYLFVIVTDLDDVDALKSYTKVYDKRRQQCFEIFSTEWVNIITVSVLGITLRYDTEEKLHLLKQMCEDFVIVE